MFDQCFTLRQFLGSLLVLSSSSVEAAKQFWLCKYNIDSRHPLLLSLSHIDSCHTVVTNSMHQFPILRFEYHHVICFTCILDAGVLLYC